MHYLYSVPGHDTEYPQTQVMANDPGIDFENVHFAYDTAGHEALNGISFTIRPGQMVALAGHSGAGKRSCIKLLQRQGASVAGTVRIGGADVRDLPTASLRGMIAHVPRDCDLLPDSLADNFHRARGDATTADIADTARLVEVDAAIARLPLGFDTPYSVWSEQLTAAERQRIALACAILRDVPIVLIDETHHALSATDAAAWQKALWRARRGRTVLLISQRLDTLQMADNIIVLERGKVVEEGRHAVLVAWKDRYARLIADGILR